MYLGGVCMWFIILSGSILFLVMEHPLIFWLVALPLGIISIISFIAWLKK